MDRMKNLRDMVVTTSSGKDVRDTKMLSGEAKDALHGKNELKQHTSSDKPSGPFGGKAAYK